MLLLLCCAFFCAIATPRALAPLNNHHTKITKVFAAQQLPANPLIKFNLMGSNQEGMRQFHKVNSTVYTAFLAPQNTSTCTRYFNYFSGYNDHRYTLPNADFLFPFHGFW